MMKLAMEMIATNKIKYWCYVCHIDGMVYGKQAETIRKGMDRALIIPVAGNGTTRSEIEIKIKIIISPNCPRWQRDLDWPGSLPLSLPAWPPTCI